MTAPASVKAELHELIDGMSNEQAQSLLDYLNMTSDPDELTEEEEEAAKKAMEEYLRGEAIDGAQLERELGVEVST